MDRWVAGPIPCAQIAEPSSGARLHDADPLTKGSAPSDPDTTLTPGAFPATLLPFSRLARVDKLQQARKEIERLTSDLAQTRDLVFHLGKLAELGRMSAAIVHEMNQPLVGIKSFAQMVLRKLDPSDPNFAKIRLIEEQAVHLEDLVDRLRRFSRRTQAAPEPIDVHVPLFTALAMMEFQIRKRGIDLERRPAESLPRVMASPAHLQQVFVNLLSNARDALEGAAVRRIHVSTNRTPSGDVEVIIADSGTGVAPEVRGRLFEPFFTTKDEERGTGLGLYICRELCALYGGRVDLCPEGSLKPPLRTGFTVRFPPAP
jgi:C4-dicarboxylate-specific signal transduction histidine kinase